MSLDFKRRRFARVPIGLCLLGACGTLPSDESRKSNEPIYEIRHNHLNSIELIEECEYLMPNIGEAVSSNKHKLEFPLYWLHFNRPLMLYIDDPPGLDDSLMIY